MMYHGSSIKTWLCLVLKSEHTSKLSGRVGKSLLCYEEEDKEREKDKATKR